MSISLRTFIHWSPDSPATSPHEPTATLVLSTPANRYLDVRYLLPSAAGSNSERHSPPLDLAVDAHTLATRQPVLDGAGRAALDWAFCGTCERAPAAAAGGQVATFVHELDSRTLAPRDVRDQGLCTPQRTRVALPRRASDDEEQQQRGVVDVEWELEEGEMPDPRTGRVRAYREGWLSVVVPGAQGGSRVVCLQACDAQGALVGCVIRVGGFVQSVLRTGVGVKTGRWVCRCEGIGVQGWEGIGGCGEMGEGRGSPVGLAMRMTRVDPRSGREVELEEGDEAVKDGRVWRVVEVH